MIDALALQNSPAAWLKNIDESPGIFAPEKNPVLVYLARIRTPSRAVTRSRLRMLASQLLERDATDEEVRAFPWSRLEPAHCAALSSRVSSHYAPATARALLVVFRGIVRACWTVGAYTLEEVERRTDAFASVNGSRLPAGVALSPEEVSRMWSLAIPRDRVLLALLLGAGLRRAEAADATWDRFDGSALRLVGKGDRERLVPLPPWAREELRRHRLEAGPILCRRTIQGAGTDVAISPSGIYYALRLLGRRAGVEISPHDGRRTFISELLDVAGHASPATTARYDRRGDRAARDAVAKVRALVSSTEAVEVSRTPG
jgi:integrase